MKKEEVEKILQVEGMVRGVVFQTDAQYILEKKGEKGLEKVEKETEKLGCPIKYEKIKPFQWYPIGMRVISLLAAKKAFGWGDEEIFDMGNSAPKFSLIVKMLLKYFVSLKKSFQESPHYWRKHYTVGKIELPEFHEDKKWLIIRLKDIKIHPILCTYLAGYFLRIAQYVIKSPKIEIKEIKCMHRGDPYHDFLFKWK
jgi:hypothetical protein